jgi:hypothetical protein
LIRKIISGGQTGVDRAALDVAFELGIAIGGWIPRGRRAEDGIVPSRYVGLEETDTRNYAERTRRNVRDSDATLVMTFGKPTGGTALTIEIAGTLGRPCLVVDLSDMDPEQAAVAVCTWLDQADPRVLNVAGPRLSKEPGIAAAARTVLRKVLSGQAA